MRGCRARDSWARIDNVLLPVSVSSWQIECCGEPSAVDQMVRWQLLFTEAGRWPGVPPEHEVTLTGRAEPFGWEFGEQDRTDVRLRVGAAVLYWSAPEELAGAVTATGTVHEDHHAGVPEDFPATTGRVRRIRVESRDFTEERWREWVYAGPSASYRDVSTSPTRFDDLTGDAVRRRSETGVLVDLEVGDLPPSCPMQLTVLTGSWRVEPRRFSERCPRHGP
jgi:hypothetical protein